ncbi:MAG: putative Alpha/beta hydrolase fold [Gemmatimonadetes bacterium]|jgi:pimeloyl-ACP methyl ester carboxylesterase|nr:putative Alpha/beta hydrolase fold [Gemmatimonadota bacterium]
MPHSTTPLLHTIEAPAGGGVPVLCLHGLFAGAWVFDALLPRIAARGHPASALSFRGHPPAPSSADMGRHTIADYCDDAADAARRLGRPIVIGHSLGGLVAQMLVAQGLARAAVLVSSAPPRGISVISPALLARMARYLPALLLSRPFKPADADLDALVLNRVPAAERAAIRDRLVADSGRAAREAALGVVRVPVESVRAPVLVVSGDDDRFVPLGVARKLATRYAAPLHVAAGHGHFLFAEPGWQAHADVMLDWIATLVLDVPENSPA